MDVEATKRKADLGENFHCTCLLSHIEPEKTGMKEGSMEERYTTSTSFQEPHIPGASPPSLNLNRATNDLQTSWESYNNTLLASYLV